MWHATTNFEELVPDLKERMFAWRQYENEISTHRPGTLPHRPDKYSANRNNQTCFPPAYLIGGGQLIY